MENFDKAMRFDYKELSTQGVRDVLNNVYRTLDERGYNAIDQIAGYLLLDDPAYILRQNEVKGQIRHIDRGVIMGGLASYYLKEQSR